MYNLNMAKTAGCGVKTATAGTAITELVRARRGLTAVVNRLVYTPGANTHLLTIMQTLSYTTLKAAAAAAQLVVTTTVDPGTATVAGAMAANDFLVIEKPDGSQHLGKIASVAAPGSDGSVAVTLTANVPTGGFNVGAKVYFLGAPGDGHQTYSLATGATRTKGDSVLGLLSANGPSVPMLIHIDNVTAAGTIDECQYGWYMDAGLSGQFAPQQGAAEGEANDHPDGIDQFGDGGALADESQTQESEDEEGEISRTLVTFPFDTGVTPPARFVKATGKAKEKWVQGFAPEEITEDRKERAAAAAEEDDPPAKKK